MLEKSQQSDAEDQHELKVNVKYARNKFLGLSKGYVVTDKNSTSNSFHTFNIEFKDEVANNLNKYEND